MTQAAGERGAAGPLPTFLGLGVLKAGTTLLHDWVAQHPQVSTPLDRKEVDFFSRHYDRGLPWYLGLFAEGAYAARGEFSVTYLHDPVALERITTLVPDVRCLVSLRDPMARLRSQHRHFRMGTGYSGSLAEFVAQHPGAVERSLYAPQLGRLFAMVPREHVLVMVFEEFTHDPSAAATGLYRFLGVDPGFTPDRLHGQVNETMDPRWGRAVALRSAVRDYALERDVRWLSRLGRSPLVKRLLFTPRGPTSAAPTGGADGDVTRQLAARFAEDTARTSALLDRDLSGLWGGR